MSALLSVTALVFAYSVASRYLGRWAITAPMVFLAAGWVIGPDGLSLVDIGFEETGARLLAEATLVLVLFADATRVDVEVMRRQFFDMPGRLLGIEFPSPSCSAAWAQHGLCPACRLPTVS